MSSFNCVALHCFDAPPESQEPHPIPTGLRKFPNFSKKTVATLRFHRKKTFGNVTMENLPFHNSHFDETKEGTRYLIV